jgi:hypothetical protein
MSDASLSSVRGISWQASAFLFAIAVIAADNRSAKPGALQHACARCCSQEQIFYAESIVENQSERAGVLVAIKLLHTVIWFILAGCIVAIPLAGIAHQFPLAAALTGFVLTECAILAVNRARCR